MPIELGFILMRLAAMAEADESLRERQPWKAAYEQGLRAGSATRSRSTTTATTSDVKVLMGGILQAFAGQTRRRVRGAPPTPSCAAGSTRRSAARSTPAATYRWSSCCATSRPTGSRTTSPRVATATSCGRSPRRSTASRPSASSAARTRFATRMTSTAGRSPTPPRWTSSTTGRSSRCASGAASGGGRSSPEGTRTATSRCCEYAGGPGRPALRLLVLHDDDEREFDYTAGAEKSLEHAAAKGWTVVSVKNDWATVFGEASV